MSASVSTTSPPAAPAASVAPAPVSADVPVVDTSGLYTLIDYALAVLATHDPVDKCTLTQLAHAAFTSGALPIGDQTVQVAVPDRPARPLHLTTVAPAQVVAMSAGLSVPAAVRLVHAQAHIESYAVDLSWDIIARFSGPSPATGLPRIPVACNNNSDDAADDASAVEENRDGEMTFEVLPRPFFENWLQVASDEARHFMTWHRRLVELGAHYGVLPVHDGLWESALRTHGSLPARLAVVHMVHEAHGLDCGPQLAAKLRALGDARSAAFLQQIQLEEISHVGAGVRWFKHVFDRAAQVDKEKLALQQQKHDKQQHAEPKPEDDSKEEASSTLVIAEDANADTAADTAAAAAAKEKAATASCSSTHAALSSPGAQKQVALAYESAQVALFHQLVRTHFAGALRPPFAAEERLRAGMGPEWYEPLAGDRPSHRSSNSADAGSAEGGRRLLPHQIKAQERAERNAKLAKERAAAGLAIAAAKAAAKADAAAAAVGTDGEAADAAIDDMSADAVDTASSATVATNNATENSGDA